jgi:hypothetical protein
MYECMQSAWVLQQTGRCRLVNRQGYGARVPPYPADRIAASKAIESAHQTLAGIGLNRHPAESQPRRLAPMNRKVAKKGQLVDDEFLSVAQPRAY